MNKFKKITALLLGALLSATLFASCGGGGGEESQSTSDTTSQKEEEIVIPIDNAMYHYNGTHVYTAVDTNRYLVQNGATEYKLVIPANYEAAIITAKSEFTDLFRDATGITITAITDDKVDNAASGKYISLGRTKLLQDSGIVVDYATLTADGHRIVTKDDDIFLCGGKEEGTIFAVYTFMKLTFNYETYLYDCKEIDEGVREKRLKDYNVTDIPDFKSRWHSADVTMIDSSDYDENMFAWRLGYYGKDATRGYHWMPIHQILDDFTSPSKASTNASAWFPEKYYKDINNYPDTYHPKWFSDNGGEQLCFSAHGDEAEYEAMVDLAFRKVESHLKHYTPDKYPRYNVISFTHMDNLNYCTCAKCAEISSHYGNSQAAVQLLFMNDLTERVDELLAANTDKDWYREDLKLLLFAYNHNFTPPARYDAVQKKYVPIDSKVIGHDRLIAWFCMEADEQIAFDDDKNSSCLTALDGWRACMKTLYFWDYGTNFKCYMMPVDTFQFATPEMYAYFCNQSDAYWFTQYQDRNYSTNTAWTNLKVYLTSKLAWDTSLNEEELISKWMNAVYRDAAPIMKKLFLTWRSYNKNVLRDQYGASSKELLKVEYWPIGMLETWLGEIDKAKAAIDRYRITNPTLYEALYKHVEVEAISYIYIILETQGYTIATDKRVDYINRIKEDLEYPDFSGMVITSKQTVKAWVEGLTV